MNVLGSHNFVQYVHRPYNHIQQMNDHQYRTEYRIRKEHCGYPDVPIRFRNELTHQFSQSTTPLTFRIRLQTVGQAMNAHLEHVQNTI